MVNVIHIVGDIDEQSFKEFNLKMNAAENDKNPRHRTHIKIILHSEGGLAMSALAFYDRIKMAKAEVTIIGTGFVGSAAVLILAAGKHRQLTKNTWVMVHDDTPSPDDVKKKRVVELRKTLSDSKLFEDQWNELMARNSRTSAIVWKDLHESESYLTPTQCLALGLIEEII